MIFLNFFLLKKDALRFWKSSHFLKQSGLSCSKNAETNYSSETVCTSDELLDSGCNVSAQQPHLKSCWRFFYFLNDLLLGTFILDKYRSSVVALFACPAVFTVSLWLGCAVVLVVCPLWDLLWIKLSNDIYLWASVSQEDLLLYKSNIVTFFVLLRNVFVFYMDGNQFISTFMILPVVLVFMWV